MNKWIYVTRRTTPKQWKFYSAFAINCILHEVYLIEANVNGIIFLNFVSQIFGSYTCVFDDIEVIDLCKTFKGEHLHLYVSEF